MTIARILLSLAAGSLTFAEAVKDREGAVRGDRAKMENDARWIYNDYDKGFAEAKRTGKPLLVVLRCVPCMACMGMDQSVLTDASLAPLLDQFVCVRVINANALDLALFQVDWDLSFSTVFFNGDGTVYGRFGSWTHQKNSQDTDIAGYKAALAKALEVHGGYPANKASLKGKQGVQLAFRTPVEMPLLATKYGRELDWQGKVVQSCVHCHQVGDALRASYRVEKKPVPDELIYPWPAPETVGITLDARFPSRVESVADGSIAAKAGLKAGDELLTVSGQHVVSIADVSWILHTAGTKASIPVQMKRAGASSGITLELPDGWRHKTDIGKRVAAWSMRGMATGGLLLEDLPDDERSKRNLPKDSLALLVKFVGQFGPHGAAKKAGFQKDDVLVAVDGLKHRMSEAELFGHLLQKRMPGEQVETVLLRGDEKVRLQLPMQ